MTSRVDMHCHSTASQLSRLGVQRSLGLPECATPPEEVYELARQRGMDFVTITDHDTIDGCLELADRPDCFVSEELTARFAGEPQAVHVLCYGITPGDHEWLQANAGDLEACAAYLREQGIACALAHPFYNVAAPLTARHRRRLAELFPVWEVRNGSRAAELNMPAVVYVETHGSTGIGGSDDHAGVDIGRTFTEAAGRIHAGRVSRPPARQAKLSPAASRAAPPNGRTPRWRSPPAPWSWTTPGVRAAYATSSMPGHVEIHSAQPGDGAEDRAAGRRPGGGAGGGDRRATSGRTTPARCSTPGSTRSGSSCAGRELLRHLQAEDFSHADLYRRARRVPRSQPALGDRRGDDRGRSRRPALGRQRRLRRPAAGDSLRAADRPARR